MTQSNYEQVVWHLLYSRTQLYTLGSLPGEDRNETIIGSIEVRELMLFQALFGWELKSLKIIHILIHTTHKKFLIIILTNALLNSKNSPH